MVLHAQVMTPGIIFNSEHLIIYGEYDDGKIRDNSEFKKEIQPLMDKLEIVSNDIKNEELKVDLKDYIGHPEVKGVIGIDKRKYFFDLVHIFPRDLNFDDPGALIRPELLQEYRGKIINDLLKSDEIKQKLNRIQDEMDNISKTAKDQKEMMKLLEKPFEERENFYTELETKARKLTKLNTVYNTEFESTNATEEDINTLKNISKFLKEEVITKLFTYIQNDEDNLPSESESLYNFIHKFGISSRYFGEIIKRIDENPALSKSLSWFKSLILREMLTRGAESAFNDIFKTVPMMYSQAFAAYFLNVFLGHSNQIKALDYFNVSATNSNAFKFTKPETITSKESGENTEKSTTTTSKVSNTNKESGNNKKKKNRKRKNNGNKVDINLDFKYFLTENLVGANVNFPIDTNETSVFVKPTEVIFIYLFFIFFYILYFNF